MSAVPLFQRQLDRLREVYPSAVLEPRADGSMVVTVPDLVMPPGWDRTILSVSMILPAGYPTAKPSGFETTHDLRTADGRVPTSGRGDHSIDGRPYAHFCWQPSQQWENDDNELWKRFKFALRRFAEHMQ